LMGTSDFSGVEPPNVVRGRADRERLFSVFCFPFSEFWLIADG